MPESSRMRSIGGSVSMPGILAFLCGAGLLFTYWKYAVLWADWPRPARLSVFAVAVLLTLWGLKAIVFGRKTARRVSWARRRRALTGPGGVYLAMMSVCFVGSLLGQSNMLMLVFALMAGPFVLNGWATFSMLKRTRVTRNAPRRAMAGDLVSVELVFENRKRLLSSWVMDVGDRIAGRDEEIAAGVLFTRVPPRSERRAHYQLRLMRRGRYRLGPIVTTTRFPLGLVERGLEFDAPGEILVTPRLGRLASNWKREQLMATELVQRREPRRGVYDDEFHRIREYRPGDNPRAIHWRTSARHSELMLREFHQSRDRDLAVYLDLWQPVRPQEEDLRRVELAVSFAATVCVDQMRESRDSVVSLVLAGSDLVHWQGQAGPAAFDSLLEVLADAQASPAADADALRADAAENRPVHARALLITTRPDGRGAGAPGEWVGQGAGDQRSETRDRSSAAQSPRAASRGTVTAGEAERGIPKSSNHKPEIGSSIADPTSRRSDFGFGPAAEAKARPAEAEPRDSQVKVSGPATDAPDAAGNGNGAHDARAGGNGSPRGGRHAAGSELQVVEVSETLLASTFVLE